MSLEIQEFQSGDRIARRMWQFDCRLYRNDRGWMPPRKRYLRYFSANSELSRTAGLHSRHFVAQSHGEVVGHVSAFVNRELRVEDEPVGSLGYFECVEDDVVASSLLGEAEQWLHAGYEIRRVWAPFNCDIWHGYRLMTRGFDTESFVGEPRNPPYYPNFFEQFGFSVLKTWLSVELNDRSSIQELQSYSGERYREMIDSGYRFRWISPRHPEQVRTLYQLILTSYAKFLGFTNPLPNTQEDLAALASHIPGPGLSCVVYDRRNAPCGFAVAYVDPSASIRAMRGRLGTWARLSNLWNRCRHRDRVIFYLIGITPEEYGKHHGLGRAVCYATLERILQNQYSQLLLAIIAEDSPAKSLVGRFLDTANREYALYELRRR